MNDRTKLSTPIIDMMPKTPFDSAYVRFIHGGQGANTFDDQPIVSRLKMLAEQRNATASRIAQQHADAEAQGELWMVMAAMTYNDTRRIVDAEAYNGTKNPAMNYPYFAEQNPRAGFTMDPISMMGSKSEIISQLAAMFDCSEFHMTFFP